MCCAVQSPQLEIFLSPKDELEGPKWPNFEGFPVLKNTTNQTVSDKKVCDEKGIQSEKISEMKGEAKTQAGSRKTSNSSSQSEEEGVKKKKKKWKKLALADTGFNMSLFPRPTAATIDEIEAEKVFNKIEAELDEHDAILSKCESRVQYNQDGPVYDGGKDKVACKWDKHFLRHDRDRRVRKAGKQVKDKYCTNVTNNDGRKKLYIHHRLFKLINLELRRMTFLPSPKHYTSIEIKNKDTNETRSRLKPQSFVPKPAPVQNLHHTLHQTNAPTDLETTLVNLLISLQHRDLTPEDYDLLLQLDESVAPKTIDKSLLTSFETDTVTEDTAGELCPVCMDQYEVGQDRKFLPCGHAFHASCIDRWLENSSRNCPVDGLPVDS